MKKPSQWLIWANQNLITVESLVFKKIESFKKNVLYKILQFRKLTQLFFSIEENSSKEYSILSLAIVIYSSASEHPAEIRLF